MDDALKKAKKFVSGLKTDGVPVQSAFLFGSYAKGTAKTASDIDICIVSPSFGKDYYGEMASLRKKALKIDVRIEPIPLSPEDFFDPYSTLSSEIRTTGLPI